MTCTFKFDGLILTFFKIIFLLCNLNTNEIYQICDLCIQLNLFDQYSYLID